MTNDECLMTKERLSPNAEASIQSFRHLSIRASFIRASSLFFNTLFIFQFLCEIFANAMCDLSRQF